MPLGATDMVATISAAGESFAAVKDGLRRRTALYIGDGMSGASMLAPEVVGPRIAQLRDLHLPFNSYAIGRAWTLRCWPAWPGRPAGC